MAAKINLRTGKIIGAKRGSFSWHHEKAHLIYDNLDQGINDGVNQNNAIYLTFLFLVLGQFWFIFKCLSVLSVTAVFYYFIKEELWCNAYALKQLKK